MPWLEMKTEKVGNEMYGAVFSATVYRYSLWRFWNYPAVRDGKARAVMFIMANPSTAGALYDDPTIRKCTLFASMWGYDGLYVGNLIARIDTKWKYTSDQGDEYWGPETDKWIMEMRDKSVLHVAAWGFMGKMEPERARAVRGLFPKLYHLGLSKDGQPKHPLYISPDVKPILWEESR